MGKLAITGGSPIRRRAYPIWPQITGDDRAAVERVCKTDFTGTREKEAFISRFMSFSGALHCLLNANGTVSIELILRAMDIGFGDEVILPPYTFIATLSAVVFTGAKPVFADIDSGTYNISPESVKEKITPRTRAVIAVAVGGRPPEYDKLEAICRMRWIYLIGDAAQAIGAQWRSRDIGLYGDAASFSCQNSKNLTCGEGGIVVTGNAELFEKMRLIMAGGKKDGRYAGQGQDIGMDELRAALLSSQMNKWLGELVRRERSAAILDELLSGIDLVCVPKRDGRETIHAYHLYILRLNGERLAGYGLGRSHFLKAVRAEGIPLSGGYSALYRFPCASSELTEARVGGKIDASPLPNTEKAAIEGTWLPHKALLGDMEDTKDIADAIVKVCENIDELREANRK